MVRFEAAGVPESRGTGRRPEPRWMTLADLVVIVAGVAAVMTISSQGVGWPLYLAPPPFVYFVIQGGLGLTVKFGLVLALVVLCRRGRYGGQVRPAEWLALGLASLWLLESVPNLDGAVNAYYVATGSKALEFWSRAGSCPLQRPQASSWPWRGRFFFDGGYLKDRGSHRR